jgi:SAM-dependent methyltransferase
MIDFYEQVLRTLLTTRVLERGMEILVICGGETDRETLQKVGFTNVVIANLDTRMVGDAFHPYQWNYQNAESLTYPDNSFDFVLVHSGLHHCLSPHQGLLEMYRVARKGLLLFEPYDNVLTRIGVRLGIGQDYEHAAVFYNDLSYGGVMNTHVPNYVYRFTRHEIIKSINAHAPHAVHQFKFVHKIRVPWVQLKGRKNRLPYYGVVGCLPVLKLIELLFPTLCNNFAAIVLKPEIPQDLHSWLVQTADGFEPNRPWYDRKYR